MKILRGLISLVLCGAAARAEVLFQGYMITPERSLFVLSAGKERTSGWLTLGQNFEGFSVSAFDAISELLTVEKDGTPYVLRLVDGKIQTSTASQGAMRKIVVTIAGQESLTVGDDAASLDALKTRLTLVARVVPQPSVMIRVPADSLVFSPDGRNMRPASNLNSDRIPTVLDLVQALGIRKFSIQIGNGPNQAPEVKSGSKLPQ